MLVFQSVEMVYRNDMMVGKIPFVGNLAYLFTKTLTGKVFFGHKDNIGFK